MTTTGQQEPGVPRIGVSENSLPEMLHQETGQGSQDEESSWWNTRTKTRTLGPDNDNDMASLGKKWRSTTSEEIQRFRHVPVVGRLPWRTQYVFGTFLLLVSLLPLLWLASSTIRTPSGDDAQAMRQGLYVMESGVAAALRGQKVDTDVQKNTVARAMDAAKSSTSEAGGLGRDLFSLSDKTLTYYADAQQVVQAAKQVNAIINETIQQLSVPWRNAGQSGEWESVEAVNFAQLLADLQYLQNTSLMISQGKSDISTRFNTSRQNIEQSLRVFASSPSAAEENNITRSYRIVAAGFTKMSPLLNSIQGRAQAWNNLLGMSEIIAAKKSPFLVALDGAPVAGEADNGAASKARFIWLAGLMTILSVALLMYIAWKQQRWSLLHAQSANEELQMGIGHMGDQLKAVAGGDLSFKVHPANQYFSPISSGVNSTTKKLRHLLVRLKETAEATNLAMAQATDAAGILVEGSHASATDFASNVDSILEITTTVQSASDLSAQAQELAFQTMDRVEAGQTSVVEATSHVQQILEKSADAATKAERIHRSIQEIQSVAALHTEISGQTEVLAIQAALQATKAGEAGQGFRVVADALKTLAQKSIEGARRISSLVESVIADVSSLEDSLTDIAQKTEDGVHLGEVSMESSLLVRATLDKLKDSVQDIHASLHKEAEKAALLATHTSEGLAKAEVQKLNAQNAADALISVMERINEFDQSINRFKV